MSFYTRVLNDEFPLIINGCLIALSWSNILLHFFIFLKTLSLRVPLLTVQVLILGPLYAHSEIIGGVVGVVIPVQVNGQFL